MCAIWLRGDSAQNRGPGTEINQIRPPAAYMNRFLRFRFVGPQFSSYEVPPARNHDEIVWTIWPRGDFGQNRGPGTEINENRPPGAYMHGFWCFRSWSLSFEAMELSQVGMMMKSCA